MSDVNNLVYICVHCGQVVENKDSDWHDRQCPAKNVNVDEDQEDIELNVDEVEEETPEEKQVEKDDYVLRLINAVRLHTILWDKYQKRDFPKRQECWSQIEQELGSQPGVPRRDWTHLREKYRGEKSYLNRSAQAGRTIAPRWEYFNHLTFLDQDIRPRARKPIPAKTTASKVVSTKIITVNGSKVVNRNNNRAKRGPKPGSTRKKPVPQKPISRPRRDPKPTHPDAIKTMNDVASERAKLNELRVVVSRNDYRDLTTRKSVNNMASMNDSNSRKRTLQSEADAASFKQSELATLRERKTAMLALNVSTHRLLTDLGLSASPTFAVLKDGVADLYRIWDEIVQKGNQQLCALQAVQQFGARLTELQCALRRDKDALAVLDAALQAGATNEVASSVRDVARLLSEKQDANCQNGNVLNESLNEDSSEIGSKFGDTTVINLAQEGGSLSDSGISDSGSEQELSERERRLAALRRLTRTLESQLAPGSEALAELWKRVEDAEAELRTLQKQCRELIVRTAASVESRGTNRATSPVNFPIPIKRKKIPSTMYQDTEVFNSEKSKGCFTSSGDPESEPSTPNSWIWRILRAALPFQLALVALFCAACLLEPHCCEAANSLNLSLTPQLRYVRGPPPV